MNFIQDLSAGLKQYRLWFTLAKLDLKARFRGTTFGTLWIVLAMAIKILAISIVYSYVLNKDFKNYLLFLSTGLIIWQYISSLLNTATITYLKASNFLQQMPMPLSLFAYQNIARETLVFVLYLALIIPILIFVKGISLPQPKILLAAVTGFILLVLNGFFATMWLGWLTARFRDFQHVVTSLVQVAFLVSPVLWPPPESLRNHPLVLFNPFYHLLEIVRAPLLQGQIPWLSLQVATGLLLFSFLLDAFFYNRVKRQLVLWL